MRHFRWRLVVGLVGLLPAAGCVPLTGSTLPNLPAHSDPAAAGKATQLPARKTAEVCLVAGEKLEKGGYPGEAIGQYEKARSENPGLHLERKLAVLYEEVGEFKKAMEEYDKALKRTPNDPGLLTDIGYCFYSQRKFDEAEAYLKQALKFDPNHALATRNLALTLAQKGSYEESLKLYAKVDDEARAYSNVAFVLTAQGKKDEARQFYREALRRDPNLVIARTSLEKLEHPGKAAPAADAKQAVTRPAEEPPPRVELPDLSPVVVDPAARRKTATP